MFTLLTEVRNQKRVILPFNLWNMYQRLVFPIILILIFCFCTTAKLPVEDMTTQDLKKMIRIELNAKEDQPFGIPIQSEIQILNFCIAEGEEIYQGKNGQYYIFSLRKDTLFVRYTGNLYSGQGQFILHPIPKTDYQVLFDPVTFSETIRPFYYYEPIRNGPWLIKSDTEILFEKVYDVRLEKEPMPIRCPN